MQLRVEEIAARAGVTVAAVRFYQGRNLVPPPRRAGRTAVYSEEHLAALRRIRRLKLRGVKLDGIRRLARPAGASPDAALLAALVKPWRRRDRALTRTELSVESGVPEPLLAALEEQGMLRPLGRGAARRYDEADVRMVRAGLEILGHGFPLQELLGLAARHAGAVGEVVDRAIDLFDSHVRKPAGSKNASATARAFGRLLPAITTMVALHFQRTLVARAIERLVRSGGRGSLPAALRAARRAAGDARLEVPWR